MASILGSDSYGKASAPAAFRSGAVNGPRVGASILPRIEQRRSPDVQFARFPLRQEV
jgi:hypothetical protein